MAKQKQKIYTYLCKACNKHITFTEGTIWERKAKLMCINCANRDQKTIVFKYVTLTEKDND